MSDIAELIVELGLIVGFGYVLPIVHVLRSNRTEPGMRVFWCGAIVVFGVVGYFFWWLMTTPKAPKRLDARAMPPYPVRCDGEATLYIMRWAFYGIARANVLYLDDRNAAPAAIVRGRRWLALRVAPGHHTLIVKRQSVWTEHPFDARAGESLAFSLNPVAEDPLTSPRVEGWLDEATARYFLAKLPRAT
jgi:hypothetical protein